MRGSLFVVKAMRQTDTYRKSTRQRRSSDLSRHGTRVDICQEGQKVESKRLRRERAVRRWTRLCDWRKAPKGCSAGCGVLFPRRPSHLELLYLKPILKHAIYGHGLIPSTVDQIPQSRGAKISVHTDRKSAGCCPS